MKSVEWSKSNWLPIQLSIIIHGNGPLLKKNGPIDIAEKKTPKMRVTVEKPDSDQYFVPGKIGNPDPERNALFQAGSGLSIFLGTKYWSESGSSTVLRILGVFFSDVSMGPLFLHDT